MHYGLNVGGWGVEALRFAAGQTTSEFRGSATTGTSVVKAFQAAELKTEDGIVGDTMDPGSEFAISDTYLTKISYKHAGRGCGLDVVSPGPAPASDPAAAE
jgi:hypothetical protein